MMLNLQETTVTDVSIHVVLKQAERSNIGSIFGPQTTDVSIYWYRKLAIES